MAATFNPALQTNLDKVRFAVGDTDMSAPIVQNETITALLAEAGATPVSVSASVAQFILTVFQQQVTYDVDGEGERFSDRAKNYATTVALLTKKAADEAAKNASEDVVAATEALGGGIMPMGTSRTSNRERAADPDRAANYSARGWPE